MEERSINWDISDLYGKSWQIIKNNKVLWLFGMAAVTFSSGSSSSNLSSKNFDPVIKLFQNNGSTPTSGKLTQVLGASASSPFIEILSSLFFSVPLWLYVLLGIGVLLLVLVNVVLGIIYQAWVNGALISGIYSASTGQKPTINQSSNQAFTSIKGIIWLNIVPYLVFFLIAAILFAVLIFSIVLLPSIAKAIPIILAVLAVITFLIGLLLINLTQIWASRRVILDKKPAKESFWSSFKIVKKKFWHMVLLAIVNTMISIGIMVIMAIPMLIVGGVAVFSFIFSKPNPSLIPILIVIGVVLFLLYTVGYTIFSGILNSFKASVWTLAYNHIKGVYNE